jgi:hypothetical protein
LLWMPCILFQCDLSGAVGECPIVEELHSNPTRRIRVARRPLLRVLPHRPETFRWRSGSYAVAGGDVSSS